jgi:hypothetical protein
VNDESLAHWGLSRQIKTKVRNDRLTSAIIGEVSVSMDQLQFNKEEKLQLT